MKKYLPCASLFLAILYICYCFIPFFVPSDSSFCIIAHRGNSMHVPENTVPAVLSAIEAGADCIEIDIRCSEDGIPIVFHDATLQRLAGRKIAVSDLSYRELKTYPLLFADGFSDYPKTTMCSLEDVLLLIADRSDICLHLELKTSGIEEKVVSLLKKYDSACSYNISSADSDILQTVHQMNPSLETTLVLTCADDVLRYCIHPSKNPESISVKSCYVISPLIHLAHRRNQKIYAWTVNDISDARRLKQLGIDGIITDDPALLRKTLS